jgi:hypothetical protein
MYTNLIIIYYFQYLKTNNISCKEFIEYFSITLITCSQVIEKLKFEEGHLSLEKSRSITWFKEWINSLSTDELKKFCINVTGFDYPKEEITVYYYLIEFYNCIKLRIFLFISFFFLIH